ncbi:ATP-binding cassette domain-containing protein [Mobilicoccus massiliensis]|uniref:ATP-binding cassette domain-containing protein n=1 Tax=Mobilicoccus massiliensis TaxID=1522310 RepID=UPI00058FEB54|nr:ATP-binding cassette domain-containing protein [Mobilicoccus massiliensis]
MSSGAHPALEARGVTWIPLGRRTPVLDGAELRIEPGERVLLVGASGAGKSTLLRALAGVLGEAEAGDLTGEVHVDGEPLRPGDGRVGLLLQDPQSSLVAGRVGRDVAFGPENLGVPRGRIHERVADALAAVGFPYDTEHRTSALSGGETQRLALAGVLAMHPRVLLLDEPTAMLDDESAADVREAVARVVADRRVALVVVEHRLDRWLGEPGHATSGTNEPTRAFVPERLDLIDRLVVLGEQGVVIADGRPERVLSTNRDELLAAGIWLPGEPAPRPDEVTVPPPRLAVAASEPALTCTDVGLVRTPRRGLAVSRRQPPVSALSDVDLAVDAATMTVLRGRSGAGKSSLLGVAIGLDRPTSGRVVAAPALAEGAGSAPGRWTSPQLAERGAWVPQQASLAIVGRTVLDCLLATCRALGDPEGEARSRAESLATQLHLSGLEERNPYTLSGGQLRRLALAAALVHGPALLALDEPSVGQDRHTWAAVAGVCAASVRAGSAVLVSTHDDALARHADATHTLEAGRLVGSVTA